MEPVLWLDQTLLAVCVLKGRKITTFHRLHVVLRVCVFLHICVELCECCCSPPGHTGVIESASSVTLTEELREWMRSEQITLFPSQIRE